MPSAVERIQAQLGLVHGFMEQTIADCSPEVVQHLFPNSTIGSVASIYAHCVFGEDRTVHGLMQGKPRIYDGQGWGPKLNVEPPPTGQATLDWQRTFKLDLPSFREYAKAVHADSDNYLGSLKDSDLDRKIDTRVVGEQTLAWIWDVFILTHYPIHMGEIAALKGLQGQKGLPF